ncbi:hypothetical protein ACHAP5_012045 [Fusarium lateritium]
MNNEVESLYTSSAKAIKALQGEVTNREKQTNNLDGIVATLVELNDFATMKKQGRAMKDNNDLPEE